MSKKKLMILLVAVALAAAGLFVGLFYNSVTDIGFELTVPSSEVITVAGDVHVSQTFIMYTLKNYSAEAYEAGGLIKLAQYISGRWQPMLHEPNGHFDFDWYINNMRFGRFILNPGESLQKHVNFAQGLGLTEPFSITKPGRYMLVMSYVPVMKQTERLNIFDPQPVSASDAHSGNAEFIMLEFVVDESTPYRLD